jgi:acyl-CoA thioester hydrolase
VVLLELRVLYGDTDQMGIVYYANYLRYFEAGRGEFLRVHGRNYREVERLGYQMPVIDAHVRYERPARYDDVLSIETSMGSARGATFKFDYVVRLGEARLATGETVHACVNARGRPVRAPPELVALVGL